MSIRIPCADGRERERAVAAARAAARRGDLVLLPTESAYAIATDAFSPRGVLALREAKGWDDRAPLSVMVASRASVSGIATGIGAGAQRLMEVYWPGPLTVLLRPQQTLAWELPVDSPLAVRVPLHPVALAVLRATGPLVVTAANLPGMEAPRDVDDAIEQMGPDIAVALDCGELPTGAASTIVDLTGDMPVVLREGAVSAFDVRAAFTDVHTPEA